MSNINKIRKIIKILAQELNYNEEMIVAAVMPGVLRNQHKMGIILKRIKETLNT